MENILIAIDNKTMMSPMTKHQVTKFSLKKDILKYNKMRVKKLAYKKNINESLKQECPIKIFL
jgi:hypothetical protein